VVSVTDVRGVRHVVEVRAETMYEAAVLAVSALKGDGWTGQLGPAIRLDVQVQGPVVTHTISLQQVQRWLEGRPAVRTNA
jgi:hypothetical protein